MSGNDYIKFVTQQVVSYLDSPIEERKKKKKENRHISPYINPWFGMLPFVFKIIRKNKNSS